MAIKVQPSRFAVLHVEDDDDSDEKDTKVKHPLGKSNQHPTELKKKAKKKKKAEQTRNETEELRNLAFCKGPKKPGSHSTSKCGIASDSQWDQWKQKDDENVDKEYEKELSDALLQSKLEFEEKQKAQKGEVLKAASGSEIKNGEGKKNKKKNKPASTNACHAGEAETSDKQIQDAPKETKAEELRQESSMSALGQCNTTSATNTGSTEKSAKQSKVQVDSLKKLTDQRAPVKNYKEAILQREQDIIELRAENKKIEANVADIKKKNQQFCNMLGRGEMMDKTSLMAELEELQQARDKLTDQVAWCSSELEKERSKGHALKAERDKLKGSRHCGK